MSDRNGDVGTLTGGTGEALDDLRPGKARWIAPTGRGSGPTHERGVQMRERAAGGIAQGGGGGSAYKACHSGSGRVKG